MSNEPHRPGALARRLAENPLGLPATLPQPASARVPPQQICWELESDFGDAVDHLG